MIWARCWLSNRFRCSRDPPEGKRCHQNRIQVRAGFTIDDIPGAAVRTALPGIRINAVPAAGLISGDQDGLTRTD